MGFVKGISIEEARLVLINELDRFKRANLTCYSMYIDFFSAYNRINREKLFEMIRDKDILREDQMKLLQFLMFNQKICYGAHSTSTSKGVNQGSTLSPILFDLYTE